MVSRRRSAGASSASLDAPKFDPSKFTSDGRPNDRDYNSTELPTNPYTFYVDKDGVWINRHADMPEEAKAMANAVETGFKKIDRTPAAPTTQPGCLLEWIRPKFPTDSGSREKLIEIFKHKLRLVRDEAIEEINSYDEESPADLLKRKQTSEKPIAKLLVDPEQPIPISFQAQDLVRLFLCEVGVIAQLDNASAEEKQTHEWKNAHFHASDNRDARWKALANILHLQLPGEERVRRKLALDIMGDILQAALQGGEHYIEDQSD
jgi:hypothetical protein